MDKAVIWLILFAENTNLFTHLIRYRASLFCDSHISTSEK